MFENVKPLVILLTIIILFSLMWPIVGRNVLQVVLYMNKGSEYSVTYRDCLISEYTEMVIARLHTVNKEVFQSRDFPVTCP